MLDFLSLSICVPVSLCRTFGFLLLLSSGALVLLAAGAQPLLAKDAAPQSSVSAETKASLALLFPCVLFLVAHASTQTLLGKSLFLLLLCRFLWWLHDNPPPRESQKQATKQQPQKESNEFTHSHQRTHQRTRSTRSPLQTHHPLVVGW